jgi:hypothetical protein
MPSSCRAPRGGSRGCSLPAVVRSHTDPSVRRRPGIQARICHAQVREEKTRLIGDRLARTAILRAKPVVAVVALQEIIKAARKYVLSCARPGEDAHFIHCRLRRRRVLRLLRDLLTYEGRVRGLLGVVLGRCGGMAPRLTPPGSLVGGDRSFATRCTHRSRSEDCQEQAQSSHGLESSLNHPIDARG